MPAPPVPGPHRAPHQLERPPRGEVDGLGFTGWAGGCCHLRSSTELREHHAEEKPSTQLRGDHTVISQAARGGRSPVSHALTPEGACLVLLGRGAQHGPPPDPRPPQPRPEGPGGEGASVLRCPPRSHQDLDLQEGDNGRMGESSLSLGLQAPAQRSAGVQLPGTQGQRGLSLSVSVVRHCRAPTPLHRGHGPSKISLGTCPSPCLLGACSAQRESKTE